MLVWFPISNINFWTQVDDQAWRNPTAKSRSISVAPHLIPLREKFWLEKSDKSGRNRTTEIPVLYRSWSLTDVYDVEPYPWHHTCGSQYNESIAKVPQSAYRRTAWSMWQELEDDLACYSVDLTMNICQIHLSESCGSQVRVHWKDSSGTRFTSWKTKGFVKFLGFLKTMPNSVHMMFVWCARTPTHQAFEGRENEAEEAVTPWARSLLFISSKLFDALAFPLKKI